MFFPFGLYIILKRSWDTSLAHAHSAQREATLGSCSIVPGARVPNGSAFYQRRWHWQSVSGSLPSTYTFDSKCARVHVCCAHNSCFVCAHYVCSQFLFPTYFLTLSSSVWEEMFGNKIRHCVGVLESQHVFCVSFHGPFIYPSAFPPSGPMPTVQVTLHPRGLHPIAAARAWHLNREEGMTIRDVCAEVVSMSGNTPSVKAVWRAIRSVDAVQGTGAIPSTKYAKRISTLLRCV